MNRIFLTFFALCMFSGAASAQIQRTYHWYFGDRAGLDFSSGQPVVDTNGQMSVYSGCATMSDIHGNLLMYTNGKSVWNRNHQVMPNGIGLGMETSTPAQSSIIIPMPGHENIYYIFHLTSFDWKDGKQTHGLKYSVVDINIDNGMGDVTLKNELLLEPVSEALGAVMHENCRDVWVLTHKRETDDFYAFLLTENGVTQTVITTIGNFKNTPYGAFYLKISPDGRKVASSAFWNYSSSQIQDTLHIFDFNNASGVLSNTIRIADTAIGAYGFSPDNSKLYVHQGEMDAWTHQYDISLNNQASILASKSLVYYAEYWNMSDFQIGEGGILVSGKAYTPYLCIIYEPNKSGTACNLVDSAIYLQGRYCYTSLPEFVSSYFEDAANSCWNQDTPDSVSTEGVFVPNVFSPNGDGTNDILYVRGENIQHLLFRIYNRWGELVFETEDKHIGWDGTYKGKILQAGVFAYHLNAILNNGHQITKSGNITLIN